MSVVLLSLAVVATVIGSLAISAVTTAAILLTANTVAARQAKKEIVDTVTEDSRSRFALKNTTIAA